jgi:hypothetical protein
MLQSELLSAGISGRLLYELHQHKESTKCRAQLAFDINLIKFTKLCCGCSSFQVRGCSSCPCFVLKVVFGAASTWRRNLLFP